MTAVQSPHRRLFKSNNKLDVVFMMELAVLTAIVIVLQVTGTAIRLPFLQTPVSLVLVPITLGALLLGPGAGAWLGLVFGLVVLVGGITGADPFTHILFTQHPFLTTVTCLLKSVAAGFLGGLVYDLIAKKNKLVNTLVGTFVAAIVVPVVNTGIFIIMGLIMSDTLKANFVGDGMTVIYFLVIGCAGFNFLFELLFNLLLAPALHRVVTVIENRFHRPANRKNNDRT